MAPPLLTTKLYFPQARASLVSRPRLIAGLNAGLRKSLTLISAPAGYGKTTLLCDWRARDGRDYPLVWLSLDPDDNNLARFFTYVSAALERLDPALTSELVAQLCLPQLPPPEELVTILINAVSAFPRDFALILDDYHAITNSAIHTALAYLLEHSPQKFHLVLLTRADPPIPLARLRARGQLVELRTADLRFTMEEATSLLQEVMGVNLSADQVSALDQRTEGWVVGLQMAALSMQGKADPDAFINAFTGSNRYILDFLSEEVIQQQPEAIQNFLLQTSVLSRLSGPLCDAVLDGSQDSAQTLLGLERKNLFLIPLDDERKWYRYHHLFADLLFQHLKRAQPEKVNELYGRAAGWLEGNGYLEDAIGYALKAQNYENAARLIDRVRTDFWNRGELRSMISWLNTLPEELSRSQPELCLAFASYLTIAGYFDSAEKWLRWGEESFARLPDPASPAALRRVGIPAYRSVNARFHGDFERAIRLCQSALDILPGTEVRAIGITNLFLGQAHFYAGNTALAEQVLTAAIQTNRASGHLDAYLNASHHLARLRGLQGRLHAARAIYEQAALILKEQGNAVYEGAEYFGLGDLNREWNQLEIASAEIQKGMERAEVGDHIFYLADAYLARVRLALAQKDWEAARSYLQKAEQVYLRCPTSTEIAYLLAWRARINLAQGNLAEAIAWAESKAAEAEKPFIPQQEFELLTLARVWLAQGKAAQAAALLDRIRLEADNAGRFGRVLEAQMLKALAEQAGGLENQAVEELSQVLACAEPEGYMRLFLDEGPPMAKLLYKVSAQAKGGRSEGGRSEGGRSEGGREYAGKLLAAYSREQAEQPVPPAKVSKGAALIEPLSKREVEVLRLMADGRTNKEIGSQLFISVGTVKRHIVHILEKLDAANRTQAVAIARELEIL